MRLIITGGLGYIGSRLAPELASRFQAPVILIDNFAFLADGHPSGFQEFQPSGPIIQADILDFDFENFLIPDDTVIHLAAIADPARSLQEPELVERINVAGTRRIAKACAAAGVPILFPSTTSVYQANADENLAPNFLSPQTTYAATKVEAEKTILELNTRSGLRSTTLRMGTVFGASPHLRFHPAVNKFCLQAVQGNPLSVWETALKQSRPYLYIKDAVETMCFIVERRLFSNQTFNAVTLNATVADILTEIRRHVPGIEVLSQKDPRMNHLSYKAARPGLEAHGFEFSGDLETGVEEVVESLRQRINSGAAGISS